MSFFSRMGSFFSRAANSNLGRKAFSWATNKITNVAKDIGGRLLNKISPNASNFINSAVKEYGPMVTEVIGD